jgi:hypothetical protein
MNTIPQNAPALNLTTQNSIAGNTAKTTERTAVNPISSQTANINFDADVQITEQGWRSAHVQTGKSTASLSQIRDNNTAEDILNLAKSQVLNQSGTSALGKVNKDAQTLLGLLK